MHEPPSLAPHVKATGRYNALSFALAFDARTPGLAAGAVAAPSISPWHHIALESTSAPGAYQMVVEIPRGTTSKLEVQKALPGNPIMHDSKKGKVREYTYGLTFFNYGLLPQTWEDPAHKLGNYTGDNDPLDIIELGARPRRVGEVVPVKILGNLKLIDQGELDHKIIALALDDSKAGVINSIADLEQQLPDVLPALVDWLKMYKTTDGKGINVLLSDEPDTAEQAKAVVADCHQAWKRLVVEKTVTGTGFWLP
jgi:3'-phosphoadenosine 5'-phosphosulfate synthase